MMVIGYERADFTSKDGSRIEGCNVYLSSPISTSRGKGSRSERVYLSDRKAESFSIKIEDLLGKEVEVLYNQHGKLARILTNSQCESPSEGKA